MHSILSLESADKWSRVGLGVGVFCWVILAAAVVSAWHTAEAEVFFRPFYSLMLGTLIIIIIGCAGAQIGVRIVQGQRRYAADLEAILARLDDLEHSHRPDRDPTPPTRSGRVSGVPADNVRAFELGRKVERSANDRG